MVILLRLRACICNQRFIIYYNEFIINRVYNRAVSEKLIEALNIDAKNPKLSISKWYICHLIFVWEDSFYKNIKICHLLSLCLSFSYDFFRLINLFPKITQFLFFLFKRFCSKNHGRNSFDRESRRGRYKFTALFKNKLPISKMKNQKIGERWIFQ